MSFDELFANVCEALRREQRISYRALRRRFELSDDDLEDLKVEIIKAKRLARDEDEEILVWIGDTKDTQTTPSQRYPPQPQSAVEPSQPDPVETPPVEPRTPEAERRQLTVMFCDLVGSTELSGRFDPEDYRELVRAYQTTCGAVIERFGCHIAQTLGDGLLVYSGYPVAHENDAERAVRVALGILDAMTQLNERLERDKGIRQAVRVGIHTGPVVVGDVGAGARREQLALGEVPNVAARIQGLAEPDSVVISEATHRLIQAYFDCEGLGEHALRGVAEPLAVYRVMRAREAQSRLEAASVRGLTPLVGRESESALLFERWEQAQDAQGQVILLSGEAGIGKSRLVQVLKDHVAEETHTRLEGRSLPYFTNSALYPVIEMVQRALQFQPDETPEQRLEKLEQNLSQCRLSTDETVPLFAALLSLPLPESRYPPLHLTPQRQRQKTLESIVAIILELAESQPLLFVLEDLHWTDPSTLEFIELLIDQTPTVAVCVLLTCRPEFQPSWSHRSYLTEMTLNRLSRQQVEQLATQVSGGKTLPGEVIEQMVDRTDGVPLYVEEMTKAVLESGYLKETNGHYELTGSMGSLSIPATLQDSLMSRLDRLVTAKAVAQYGAVIGRQFSYELLQAVSQLDEATLQRELGRLVEAELVYQRGLLPQATYMFKHALIQDIAYGSLLRRTRQGYHRRIAEVLEERFLETVETQPELLAHHYTEAGLSELAIAYWEQAGKNAIERSGHVETISHLTQGLHLLATLPPTPDRASRELAMQLALGPALMATKGYAAPEVQQTFARARMLCSHMDDAPQLFPILMGLCRFYYAGGVMQTARELGEQLLSLAQQKHDASWLVVAQTALGTTLCFMGEFTRAFEHLKQGAASSLPAQEELDLARRWSTVPRVQCRIWEAYSLLMLGYPDQALQKNREAQRLSQEIAHPHSEVYSRYQTARFHLMRRELHTAREFAESAIPLATEQASTLWAAASSFIQGFTWAAGGERQSGLAQMSQSLTTVLATGADVFRPTLLVWFADVHNHLRQTEEGQGLLDEAQAAIETSGQRYNESDFYRLKGELLLQQSVPDISQAEMCFHRALDIARAQRAKLLELRTATSLAKWWRTQGKRQEAYDMLAPVYGWFTEGFDTADLKDAKRLLDELA